MLSRLTATLVLCLSITVTWFAVAPATAIANSSPNIVVLGDSISAAYGMPEDEGWVALLQDKLEKNGHSANVINASITGETSSGGANRIAGLLEKYQPEILILELGGNDGLRGLSLKSLRQNLNTIIQKSQQRDTQVLLLGMRIPTNYGARYAEQFHQTYHELSSDHALPFVPFFLEDVALDPSLMQADGIHPGQQAQPLMLADVWPMLEPLLP